MRQTSITLDSTARPSPRVRRGMTLLEVIIVLAIVSTLSMIAWRPMKETFDQSSRRAATREVASYLIRSRSAAVQRSRQSWFVVKNSKITVATDSAGTKVTYAKQLNMIQRHGVSIVSNRDSISFDSRGFMTVPLPTPRIIVTAGTGSDTLCVTGLGTITTRKCT